MNITWADKITGGTFSAADANNVKAAVNSKVDTIATMSDVQALTSGSSPIIYMVGRTTAGDGGQGYFKWTAGNLSVEVTADPLHGIYVPPTSDTTGSAGCFVRQFVGGVYPEWFGGDIQAAINASKIVHLLPKTYNISDPIILGNSSQLIGSGDRTGGTVLHQSDNTKSAISITGNSRKVKISGVTFTTVPGGTANAAINGGYSGGAAECVFEDIVIDINYYYGIYAADGYWENSHIRIRIAAYRAIYIHGSAGTSIENYFERCYVDHSGQTGNPWAVHLNATKNTVFNNCNFGSLNTITPQFIRLQSSNPGTKFIGCNFEGGMVMGALSGLFHISDTSYVHFDSCYFTDLKAEAGAAKGLFYISQTSSVLFSNCNIGTWNTANTIFTIYKATTGSVTLINSPTLKDSRDYPTIRDLSGPDTILASASIVNDARNVLQAPAWKTIARTYSSTGGVHNLLEFTSSFALANASAIAGRIRVSFAGATVSLVALYGSQDFDFIYTAAGTAIITPRNALTAALSARVITITLAQSTNFFTLAIGVDSSTISAGVVSVLIEYSQPNLGSVSTISVTVLP